MPRYILSEKKKNLLVDDENYTYRRERDDAKKTKTYWKCVKSDKSACTARITSLFGEPTIVKFVNQHSHTTTTFEVGCKVALSQKHFLVINSNLHMLKVGGV